MWKFSIARSVVKPVCVARKSIPVLPQFASDLDWLKSQGIEVARYNLAHQPLEFANARPVQKRLQDGGAEVLPIVLIEGDLVSEGYYPTRQALADWTGLDLEQSHAEQPQAEPSPLTSLPLVSEDDGDNGGCCSGSGCC